MRKGILCLFEILQECADISSLYQIIWLTEDKDLRRTSLKWILPGFNSMSLTGMCLDLYTFSQEQHQMQ